MKLRLILKHKWYNMIESGEKTEEYREIKPHWEKRLCNYANVDRDNNYGFKDIKEIEFVYGYTKRNMKFKVKGIHVGKGKPEWGAEPDKDYFVICLGERMV